MPENRILVCVTDQPECARLIRKGRELASAAPSALYVLHVRTRQKTLMGSQDISSVLNQLYAAAREAEAEMEIISSPEVEKTIAEYARSRQISTVVIGASPRDGRPPMKTRLEALLPDTVIVSGAERV